MQSFRTLFALALTGIALAPVARAQNDYDLDKLTAGTLGGPLQLVVQNAPASSAMFIMLSSSGGPTPIAVVDPGDPRSVEVGVELINSWFFTVTSTGGTGGLAVTVPNSPPFQGLRLHWQTFTFPGTTTTIGQISNDVVTQFGAAGSSTANAVGLGAARSFAVAFANTQLNAGQGDVIVAGGGAGTLTAATGLATTEIVDFRELSTRPGPSMANSRALHLAFPLLDGRVLVCGGADATGLVLNTCELYNPATNSWSPAAGMSIPRVLHGGCRLADGRVLVAGGTSSLADPLSIVLGARNSAEIYNPATNTWSAAANIGGSRISPALSLLPNGRALVSGGLEVSFVLGFPIAAGTTAAAQTYNPATNSWAAAAPMPVARTGHQYNQVTLPNGRVLITGGVSVSVNLTAGTLTATPLANAEYYDQPSNSWTAVNMPTARSLHSATLLPGGRVAVCGGAQGTIDVPVPLANVEVFDPSTNLWSVQPPLLAPRSAHTAAMLPDGTLVLIGGQDGLTTTASIELRHF
ncbi:MAG: Kelch repeat-containing protein [Planctomycetota bacterium]